jgi:hypothetical protein
MNNMKTPEYRRQVGLERGPQQLRSLPLPIQHENENDLRDEYTGR